MSVLDRPVGPAQPGADAPRTRPVARARVSLPALVALGAGAALVGLGVGAAPGAVGLAVVALVGGALLLARVELAAAAVIASALFDDYLVAVLPGASKALAGVLVASWALRRLRGPLHGGSRSRVTDAVLVLAVVLLLATLAHPNGTAGLAVLLRWAGFLAVTLVLVDVVRGPLGPLRAARVYVVASVLASVAGIHAYVVLDETRVVGPIGDPNDLAFFLLAAVPLTLASRAAVPRGHAGRLLHDVGLALLLVAIAGTLSRGALVGLAAVLVFAVLARQVRLRVVVALVALLATGVTLVAVALPDLVSTSLDQKDHVAGQNVSERLDLWVAAGAMTWQSPVLGLGPGSFSERHREFRSGLPVDVNSQLDVAHNTWLETSSELGLVGLAALLGVLLAGLGAAWARWRHDREPLAAAVCAALVGTSASATFVTEQYFLPLWFLVALGAALHRRALDDPAGTWGGASSRARATPGAVRRPPAPAVARARHTSPTVGG